MPHAHTPTTKQEIERLLDTFEDDLVFDVDQHSDDEQDVQAEIAEQLSLLRKHRALIAAAPEMLAALKQAQTFLRKLKAQYCPDPIAPNSDSGLDWDTQLVIHDAIEHATGRQAGKG